MAQLVRAIASSYVKPPSRGSLSFTQTPRAQRSAAPALRVSAFPSFNQFQNYSRRYMSTDNNIADRASAAPAETTPGSPAPEAVAAPAEAVSDANKEAPLEIAKKFVKVVNFINENQNDKALEALRETQSHAVFKPEMLIFLVRLLVKRETNAAAKAIQQQMAAEKAKGVEAEAALPLTKPQAQLLQQNSLEKLNRLTSLLRSTDSLRSAPLLNTLMLAYAGLSDMDTVRSLYDEAIRNGTKPSIASKYLRLQYSKDESEADRLLSEFVSSSSTSSSSSPPSASSSDTAKSETPSADESLLYSALLLALSRLRAAGPVVRKYYDQMRAKNMKISQHMFGTLVMASRERPEDAFYYFNEAKKVFGKDLSVELYNMALWTCLTTERITKMEEIAAEMKANQVVPNEMTRKLLVVPRGMAKLAKQQKELKQKEKEKQGAGAAGKKPLPPGHTGVLPKEGLFPEMKKKAAAAAPSPSVPSSSSSPSSSSTSPAAKKPAASPSSSGAAHKPAAVAAKKPAAASSASPVMKPAASSAASAPSSGSKKVEPPVAVPKASAKKAAAKPEKKEKNK